MTVFTLSAVGLGLYGLHYARTETLYFGYMHWFAFGIAPALVGVCAGVLTRD